MILLDERQHLVHDEAETPSEEIRESLIRSNAMCFYAGDKVLYHFCANGSLSLYSLSEPKIHSVALSPFDLAFFKRERRVATKSAVIRDIGCEMSMVYLEDHSFSVPTELLLR